MNLHRGTSEFGFIFLVGCGRSGTTWLQRVMAIHPEIATGPETRLFLGLRPLLGVFDREKADSGLKRYLSEEEFLVRTRAFIRSLFAHRVREAGARFFLEKTPAHGWYMSEMHRIFPEAPFVHIIRDGRDVACSHVAISGAWIRQGWKEAPTTIPQALDLWVKYLEYVQRVGAELGPRYLELRYEDLVADPDAHLVHIFRHLGLEYVPHLFRTGMGRLNQTMPVRTHVGSWKREFAETDRVYASNVAGKLLAQLGYEVNGD